MIEVDQGHLAPLELGEIGREVGGQRAFADAAFLGIFGQGIVVQPASGIVIVQTSVYDRPSGDPMGSMRTETWRGVINALGGRASE